MQILRRFMQIYVLLLGDNGKRNPEESYTKKYRKYIACSHGYKYV